MENIKTIIFRFFGKTENLFKSKEQERGLELVVSGIPQLIVSLPTGGGKSLLFMAPAALNKSKTTIVIVPLVSLREDLIERVNELGISVSTYSKYDTKFVSIIICTVEQAVQKGFLEYLSLLESKDTLQSIVIDEVHTVITEANYRPAFKALIRLRQFKCQFICLSATLPFEVLELLQRQLLMTESAVLKRNYHNFNIVFQNIEFPNMEWLKNDIEERLKKLENGSKKTIVYVRTIRDTLKWSALLNGKQYHASQTTIEKNQNLKDWKEGKFSILVATTALGMGLDVPNVRIVAHVGAPTSLISWIQQAGRSGRDGELSDAIIYQYPRSAYYKYVVNEEAEREKKYLDLFLSNTTCLNAVLTAYLDSNPNPVGCKQGSLNKCSVCLSNKITEKSIPSTHTLPFSVNEKQIQSYRELGINGTNDYAAKIISRENRILFEIILAIRKVFTKIGNDCVVCFLEHSTGSTDIASKSKHSTNNCHDSWVIEYRQIMKSMRFKKAIEPYVACFTCGCPQELCERADPENNVGYCLFPDTMFGFCYYIKTKQLLLKVEEFKLPLGCWSSFQDSIKDKSISNESFIFKMFIGYNIGNSLISGAALLSFCMIKYLEKENLF